MRGNYQLEINGIPISIHYEGISDGQDYEVEKIVAKLGSRDIYRLEDNEETGLLANTDLGGTIYNSVITKLCNESTESLN